MMNLTLIVRANIEQALADVLRGLPEVSGFTFARVEGHGPQEEQDPEVSAHDRVVGYTPHVRVDLVLEDAAVDSVLGALRTSGCGLTGRGIYWVAPVAHGRL